MKADEARRRGRWWFHSNQARLSRAGRQMASSRMWSGREVRVRMAPRREFQPRFDGEFSSRSAISVVLHCTILCDTVLCDTVLYCTALYYIVLLQYSIDFLRV